MLMLLSFRPVRSSGSFFFLGRRRRAAVAATAAYRDAVDATPSPRPLNDAGVPRKPGMTRDDLFNVNAGIAKGLVESCARYCPNAVVALIVNPVCEGGGLAAGGSALHTHVVSALFE